MDTEKIKAALDLFDASCELIGGCGDGGCIVHIRPGMHTNGGCRCRLDQWKMQRLARASRYFRDEVKDALNGD